MKFNKIFLMKLHNHIFIKFDFNAIFEIMRSIFNLISK